MQNLGRRSQQQPRLSPLPPTATTSSPSKSSTLRGSELPHLWLVRHGDCKAANFKGLQSGEDSQVDAEVAGSAAIVRH